MSAVTIEPKETGARKVMSRDLRSEPAFGSAVLNGLYDLSVATPRQLAQLTGVSELIVRSVLEALTLVDRLDFNRDTGEYSLGEGRSARGPGATSA